MSDIDYLPCPKCGSYAPCGCPAQAMSNTIALLRAELQATKGREERLREALGLSDAWPAVDLLRKLADAAEHLMGAHACDAHGWEEVNGAVARARQTADAISAALTEKPSEGSER